MRLALLAAALLSTATAAPAQTPPADRWHAKAREIYARAIAFQTVQGRNQSPQLAAYLAGAVPRRRASPTSPIHPHDETAALILRWPAARPSGRKAILLMAHMDVVEARREDWSRDPFTLGEEDGYFYGRGTIDDKQGVTAITTALLRLRAEGFQPDRDIIVLFTGDEETDGNGAELAANEWLDPSTIDFALNGDAGGGAFLADGTLLGFGIQTAEKIYQSFTLTATNPGGHSSRPRPDNAIYALAHTLERLERYRFEPMQNETTRAYFAHRAAHRRAAARRRHPPLARQPERRRGGRPDRGLADRGRPDPHPLRRHPARGRPCRQCAAPARPRDGQLPDLPRRRSGHRAGDAAPSSARPTMSPSSRSTSPARPTPRRCARTWSAAYTAAVRARHPGAAIVPDMSTGATDGLYFRARGVPVYGVDGSWAVIPADERAHGRDERLPVRAFYNDVDHWTDLVRSLAGGGR